LETSSPSAAWEALLDALRAEARREPFPIDEPVYRKAGRDPLEPILTAGSLAAPVCSIGRDLGATEVERGEPQIGSAGRMVREGVYRAFLGEEPPRCDARLAEALRFVLLTNTVPFKPPGNKAYSEPVKRRFRPFLARLLVEHWRGRRVLCLGTEAIKWFLPCLPAGAFERFWHRDDRYEAELPCVLEVETAAGKIEKSIILCPLPHPSPLNRRWRPKFPALLAARLEAARTEGGRSDSEDPSNSALA